MEVDIRSLENVDKTALVKCFKSAFQDYYVDFSQLSESYFINRWKVAQVDYRLSFGAYDIHTRQLVAFVLFSIAHGNAHNAATGCIPSHRGTGIVPSIFKHAIPILKQSNITHSTLEVITINERALKSYLKIGYSILRTYQCLKYTPVALNGPLMTEATPTSPIDSQQQVKDNDGNEIKVIHSSVVPFDNLPTQHYPPSWEYQSSFLQTLPDLFEYYKVECGTSQSFIVFSHSNNNLIVQFRFENQAEATALIARILSKYTSIRVNNMDTRDTNSIDILKQLGFEESFQQFEMKLVF